MKALKYFGAALVVLVLLAGGVVLSMRAGLWDSHYDHVVAKYAGSPSKFMTVDHAKLHYRDEGHGEVLVLLHGSSGSLHQWDHVADILKSHYRVVRLDWPPFGLSVDDTGVYSSARAADLVSGLVDGLGIKHFVMVATSNGGNVALAYAAKHPEHLDGMAFSVLPIATLHPRPSPSKMNFLLWFHTTLVPNYHGKGFYKSMFEATTPPTFQISDDDLTAWADQNELPGAPARLAAYLASNHQIFVHGDAGAAAENITVPVLLQWCDADPVVAPKTRGDMAAARFKRSKVTLIHYAGLGHFPMFENPALLARDLSTFVEKLHPKT